MPRRSTEPLLTAVLLTLPSVSCWTAPTAGRQLLRTQPAVSLSRPLNLHSTRAAIKAAEEEEEVVFTFGDAGEVSAETATAIAGEERELTQREKEIAELKAQEKFMKKDTGDAVCRTCGYTYKMDVGAPDLPPRTPFELVSDSWTCPNCKSPKAFFDPVQIEIAGFEVNQAYGLGANTWTESQKNLAIFGGLGFFFALFIGGYALN